VCICVAHILAINVLAAVIVQSKLAVSFMLHAAQTAQKVQNRAPRYLSQKISNCNREEIERELFAIPSGANLNFQRTNAKQETLSLKISIVCRK